MLCSRTSARSPATLRSANSATRPCIASAVAIVGRAKNRPDAPDALPITDAACNAASVFPSPVGAVTSNNPGPSTNPGNSSATDACRALAAKSNCSPNDFSSHCATPNPASATHAPAAATAPAQCAASSPSPATHPSAGRRWQITAS